MRSLLRVPARRILCHVMARLPHRLNRIFNAARVVIIVGLFRPSRFCQMQDWHASALRTRGANHLWFWLGALPLKS